MITKHIDLINLFYISTFRYKNCLFHKEYNMHQKFASTSVVSTTSSTLLNNQGVKMTAKMIDIKSTDVNRKRQFNEVSTSSTEGSASYTSVQVEEIPGLAKVKRKDSFFTSETFYTKVTAIEIMALLDANSGGLHAVDMISLRTNMTQYYVQADGIPQFIVMMPIFQFLRLLLRLIQLLRLLMESLVEQLSLN